MKNIRQIEKSNEQKLLCYLATYCVKPGVRPPLHLIKVDRENRFLYATNGTIAVRARGVIVDRLIETLPDHICPEKKTKTSFSFSEEEVERFPNVEMLFDQFKFDHWHTFENQRFKDATAQEHFVIQVMHQYSSINYHLVEKIFFEDCQNVNIKIGEPDAPIMVTQETENDGPSQLFLESLLMPIQLPKGLPERRGTRRVEPVGDEEWA